MDGEPQASLRFIKKIPPSGGQPAFKLTLPHQIVNRSLQHFVDADFELASSINAQQTWQGSIAPRRNKDRSEYILQGWKLFAEAHKLQAGDQVSFELVGHRRLVVKCIQAASLEKLSPIRRTPDSPEPEEQPLKSSKSHEGWSPSKRAAYPDQNTQIGPHRSRSFPGQSHHSPWNSSPRAPLTESQPMSHRVQSWLSLNLPTAQQVAPPLSPATVPEAAEAEEVLAPILEVPQAPMLEVPQAPTPEEPLANLEGELPRIFDDMHEDMHEDLNHVFPDLPIAPEAEDSRGPAPYSFRSSMESIQATQHIPTSRMCEVQSRENELRALVSSIQDRLDQSTRFALQATMGLETCVVDMLSFASQRDIRDVQAKMFRHLSSLKESLWQVLLVSNDTLETEKI